MRVVKVQAMDVLEKDRNQVLPFPKNVTVAPIVEIKSINETHQANRRDTGLKSRMKKIELNARRKASKKKVAKKVGAKKAK
jgi:hypothetical protein